MRPYPSWSASGWSTVATAGQHPAARVRSPARPVTTSARWQRAERRGLIGREDLAAVVAGLEVIAARADEFVQLASLRIRSRLPSGSRSSNSHPYGGSPSGRPNSASAWNHVDVAHVHADQGVGPGITSVFGQEQLCPSMRDRHERRAAGIEAMFPLLGEAQAFIPPDRRVGVSHAQDRDDFHLHAGMISRPATRGVQRGVPVQVPGPALAARQRRPLRPPSRGRAGRCAGAPARPRVRVGDSA